MSEASKLKFEELINKIRNLESFEVIGYSNNEILVSGVKGIIKIDLKDEEAKRMLGELKRRRPRGKPSQKQLQTLQNIVKLLVDNKVKFKVVFESKDIVIRFDLDHYVRLTDKDVRIVGFKDENDGILKIIYPELIKHGSITFLKPVK